MYLTDSAATTLLVILEMIRVLLDDEKLSWEYAWKTTYKSCSCQFNQVQPNDFEVWTFATM